MEDFRANPNKYKALSPVSAPQAERVNLLVQSKISDTKIKIAVFQVWTRKVQNVFKQNRDHPYMQQLKFYELKTEYLKSQGQIIKSDISPVI